MPGPLSWLPTDAEMLRIEREVFSDKDEIGNEDRNAWLLLNEEAFTELDNNIAAMDWAARRLLPDSELLHMDGDVIIGDVAKNHQPHTQDLSSDNTDYYPAPHEREDDSITPAWDWETDGLAVYFPQKKRRIAAVGIAALAAMGLAYGSIKVYSELSDKYDAPQEIEYDLNSQLPRWRLSDYSD